MCFVRAQPPPARFCVLANYAAGVSSGVVWVFVILRSDSVVPPAVADFFGMIRLLRLPARCRGGLNGGGGQEGFGILLLDRLADKKPHPSSIRCRGLRSSASTRSFVLGLRPADFGACVFFVFRLADMREWAGHRRFPARG